MSLISSTDLLQASPPMGRYVRVIEERNDGFISFEFSIGWPELVVELMLPAPVFAEFCARNRVEPMDMPAPSADGDGQANPQS